MPTIRRTSSIASQSLACMPATTWSPRSHQARNDPTRHVAGQHDPVVAVGAGVADVLHAEVVLVGEEVGERVGVGVRAEQVGGERLAVLDRGVPVLDAERMAEHRVVDVGDVADGVDVRVGRCAGARRCGCRCRRSARRPRRARCSARRRSRPRAGRRRGGRRRRGRRAAPSPRALMPVTWTPSAEVDAVLAVQVGEDRRHLGAEHPQQAAGRATRATVTSASVLRAAEATSRPIQPPPTMPMRVPVGQPLPEREGVVEGAQVDDRRAAARRPSAGGAVGRRSRARSWS